VFTAIARELAGFVWSIACITSPPAKSVSPTIAPKEACPVSVECPRAQTTKRGKPGFRRQNVHTYDHYSVVKPKRAKIASPSGPAMKSNSQRASGVSPARCYRERVSDGVMAIRRKSAHNDYTGRGCCVRRVYDAGGHLAALNQQQRAADIFGGCQVFTCDAPNATTGQRLLGVASRGYMGWVADRQAPRFTQ
jgi:hypothetical protein